MLKKIKQPKMLVTLLLLLALLAFLLKNVHTAMKEDIFRRQLTDDLGIALKRYANDHADALPALDPEQGCLAIPRSGLVPKYLDGEVFDRILLHAEGGAGQAGIPTGPASACACEQHAYYYVAHTAISQASEAPAGAAPDRGYGDPAQATATEVGERTDAELEAILREAKRQAVTPLLISRLPPTLEECDCFVLYLDGHVSKLKYPMKFPCTQEVMQSLQDREAALCRAATP